MTMKRARSYLYGAKLPCHATTSNTECFCQYQKMLRPPLESHTCLASNSAPWNLLMMVKSHVRSSKAAVGNKKSRGAASPFAPAARMRSHLARCSTPRTDGTQVGQAERRAVNLAYVATVCKSVQTWV